jgi:hypothetical protein
VCPSKADKETWRVRTRLLERMRGQGGVPRIGRGRVVGAASCFPWASVALAADRTAYRLSFGGADIHAACGMLAGQSLGGVAL